MQSPRKGLGRIIARRTKTAIDVVPDKQSVDSRPWNIRLARFLVTGVFTGWANASERVTTLLGWFPRVEPYIGYGTPEFSRLICRTTYAPRDVRMGRLVRGIRATFMVPATGVPVEVAIDGIPLTIVPACDSAVSDKHGYLDLMTTQKLKPGIHNASYQVRGRRAVYAPLHIIPRSVRIGIISDLDDTVIVTQIPSPLRAAINMMFRSPRSRHAVPGMSKFYSRLHRLLPQSPFFYLSTSPWNIESGFRHVLQTHDFPEGPLLLRDLDPRAGTFIPSGVDHKLGFAKQLMEDFPDMKFVLIGDNGQKDPTTFATIIELYPGRVLAVGIRQLSPKESLLRNGIPVINLVPQTDVPVFYGNTGTELARTMLPFVRQCVEQHID